MVDQLQRTAADETPLDAAPLFSADSHVVEDASLWDGILPDGYFGVQDMSAFHKRPGRVDPVERIKEMAVDGVHGEVLYPSLGLKIYGIEDAELQERAFARYNDWLAEFSATSPDKLIGIGLIATYDAAKAAKEAERCKELGLRGLEIWQAPPPELGFETDHYDPFYEAAASLKMPVSLHILTGYRQGLSGQGLNADPTSSIAAALPQYWVVTNFKLQVVADTIFNMMFSGIFERFPDLNMVLVENEIGWIPFLMDQYDFYAAKFKGQRPTGMERLPSEYFGRNLFATFFRDPVGTKMFNWWGKEGCMWSSDYPHGNSTWPNSREVVDEILGYLDAPTRDQIIRGTARRLYGLDRA